MVEEVERKVEVYDYNDTDKAGKSVHKKGLKITQVTKHSQEEIISYYKKNLADLEKLRQEKKNLEYEVNESLPKSIENCKKYIKEQEVLAKPILDLVEASGTLKEDEVVKVE
jgi:viroplasmin and RNaseH domain-containing protein